MQARAHIANRKPIGKALLYTLLVVVGFLIVYPLIWLFFASFKPNEEIFGSASLFPINPILNSYSEGWKGTGQFSFGVFLRNTFVLVVPTVALTLLSSILVAYGFSRFRFPGHKALFGLMISTMMLPNAVLIIPRYILYNKLGLLNSYKPFYLPAMLACYPFFIFMLVQFFRGLPRDLDESAKIDGCNSFVILTHILLPLAKPAVISAGIFQFVWTWNDFFNSLIYVSSVSKYPVSLGLRMSLDSADAARWNEIFAMSIVSILPCVVLFFLAQKYFVEGVVTSGIKG